MSALKRDLPDLRTSAMHALLGNATANLAGVKVHFEETRIVLCAFFFVEPDDLDIDCVSDAEGLVIADFPSPFTIETRFALISDANFEALHQWVHLRAEALALLMEKKETINANEIPPHRKSGIA